MTPPREPRTAAGRANCECGASVLVENMENHLLRQSNGPHRFSSWPMPRTKAGRRLSESLEMMGPSPQQLDAAILAIEAEATDAPLREALANELLDAIKGVLDFERVNSVIAGPYDRLRLAYNAVVKEANRAILTATPAPAPLDVLDIVKRHTHQGIWAMTRHAGEAPEDDCLLCRALVSAGVLTLDEIGAGTRSAVTARAAATEPES